MTVDEIRVKFAVDTIARALQADGAEVKLVDFDQSATRVRIAARLVFECEHCVLTLDQLQSLVRDTVEQQLGRPVAVELSEL